MNLNWFLMMVIRRTAVDNIDLQYGNLNTFFEDTVIIALKTVLPSDIVDKMIAIKIFTTMTTNDTIQVSKSGNAIRIPEFWTAFRLTTVREGNEKQFSDTLNTLFPLVHYSHLNYIGSYHSVPNDIHYSIQQSLRADVPGSTPVNHINIEGAWDLSVGSNSVRVGVFDTGILWQHDDFSWDGTNTYAGSVIKGGYEYTSGGKSSDPNDFYNSSNGHGTHTSSIIGAISNNGKNIVGIAGGDKANNKQGVELYVLKSTDAIMNTLAEAIYDAVTEFNVDVINMSAGIVYMDAPLLIERLELIKDVVKFAFESKVMMVASRGNLEPTSSYTDPFHKIYPACYPDEMICSVGATNNQGQWHDEWDVSGSNNQYTSMTGNDLDIMAPGVRPMVVCLANNSYSLSDYMGGTSASAPHISGISALMYSYFNENFSLPDYIAPEDIEYIIQRNALDINSVGPDDYTGYGLADATKSLKGIEKVNYKIEHQEVSSYSNTQINSNYQIEILNNLLNEYNEPVEQATYLADVYEIYGEVDNANYAFNSVNYNVIDAWNLLSETKGLLYANSFENFDNKAIIDNSDITNKSILKTYSYHLIYNTSTSSPVDVWIPCNINDAKLTASIYLQNPTASVDETDDNISIKIFPNPVTQELNVWLNKDYNSPYQIEIYNISGSLIKKQVSNSNQIKINTSDLSKSVYLIKISNNNSSTIKRFIKL